VFFKEWLSIAQATRQAMKTTYHKITSYPCSQELWKPLGLRANPWAHVL